MQVTCEVVGDRTEALDVDGGATYGDLLRELDFSPHEATVLVDGTPVPEDAPVAAESVQVLRLVKGG